MVRFYMHGKSVDEISRDLNIPVGTVLSRLDTGRDKIKEGVIKMINETYTKNSYEPERLGLGINGSTGMDGEPFSTLRDGLLAQNVLIAAYEKPLSVQEIAEKLGVATAFIEDVTERMLASELMQKSGNKIYTDFLITSNDDTVKNIEAAQKFADDSFDDVKDILNELVDAYRKSKILEKFNDTQLYSYAVLTMTEGTYEAARAHLPLLDYDDFPDRPNGGKWVAVATRSPDGYKPKESINAKYHLSGKYSSGFGDGSRMEEWSTHIGATHNAQYDIKYLDIEGV